MKYSEIFLEHEKYSCQKWSSYPCIYDKIFSETIKLNKPINFLEIGVCNGGSLQIWKEYLPAGSQIHGIDINPKCSELKFSENIHFHLGDATDKIFIDNLFKDIVFDIILDDGSHINKHVVKSFELLFPKLSPGGKYIVEDLHTSYYRKYGGGLLRSTSTMEFFKMLCDSLNYDYFSGKTLFKRIRDLLIKKRMKLLKDYSPLISSIGFYNAIIVIEKYFDRKDFIFSDIFCGETSFVLPRSTDINKTRKEIKSAEKLYTES